MPHDEQVMPHDDGVVHYDDGVIPHDEQVLVCAGKHKSSMLLSTAMFTTVV